MDPIFEILLVKKSSLYTKEILFSRCDNRLNGFDELQQFQSGFVSNLLVSFKCK